MKKRVFSFIDEVTEVKKNEDLTAFFTLKGDEEFLQDHFEHFPVMPGVLQLEALAQAGARLLSESEGVPGGAAYRLAEARNIRFGRFVRPGAKLRISVRVAGREGRRVRFDGRIELWKGAASGRTLTAEFDLERYLSAA